jgi:hypothetical protein
MTKYRSPEHTIRDVLEASVYGGKLVGSRGSSFRHSSTSSPDEPHERHGHNVGAARNIEHEKASVERASESEAQREREVEKRKKEAEARSKETAKMAKEETVSEGMFSKHDTDHLKQMHARDSASISRLPKNAKYQHADDVIDREHNIRKELQKRGHTVERPKHKLVIEDEMSSGTEARTKIKNVSRPDDPEPTSPKSKLAKTAEIKTKIIDEEKPLMSSKTFGLPDSLIAAVRQIVEKKDDEKLKGGKTAVDLEPKTNDKPDDNDDDDDDVKNESKHTTPKNEKEKKLAALAHPKNKITHKDVLVGRGVVKEDESEQIVEISKQTLGSYIKKASKDRGRSGIEVGASSHGSDEQKSYLQSMKKRQKGIEKATDKLTKEEAEQIDEVSKATLGSYITKVAGLPPEKVKPSREKGIEMASKKIHKEDVEFSAEEVARIAEIAKSFPAEIDEAVKKSVPSAPTAVSSPIRGPNQDQSGVGTKGSTTDYTISDEKKLRKEEVELDEGRGRPRKNPLPAGQETEGDDTHKHPMQQLEKISHAIEGKEPHFEHKDGSKSKISRHLARHIVAIHNSMRTSQEKDGFAQKVHANRDSMKAEVGKHI